jgi:hypothetical protein
MLRRSLLFAPLAAAREADPGLDVFLAPVDRDDRAASAAVKQLRGRWRNGFAPMIVDLLRLPGDPGHPARRRLVELLESQTGRRFGHDVQQWQKWIWSQPYEPHAAYGEFKGMVYAHIDPRMRLFFPPGVKSRIRLDRVDWGGVGVNGIPPLVNPAMIPAAGAGYMRDHHVVFGIASNGEARAYPKRILAWHEMARDRIGGLDFAIVYCTLCGTVIPYKARTAGRKFTFGTSGLLYESSKLMFDEETASLWPALEGRPAIGALAESGLQLEFAPVVTTTWGEWRGLHPKTLVLAPETGHQRDYSEGAAYREYFGTQQLMFPVSRADKRLRNKDEVLVIRREGGRPLAFAVRRMPAVATNGEFVILNANRVYRAGAVRFTALEREGVRDLQGNLWRITEDALALGDRRLPRFPAHRAFWFGWFAQFPETELVEVAPPAR